MTKLNYQEILEKLKIMFDTVGEFALEEQPYDFENYPEALKAKEARKEFVELHTINHKWDSTESAVEYEKLPNEYNIIKKLWKQKHGLNWEEVEQYGGEGQGDTWYSIKYFPDHDIYIKVSGWYQSYDGVNFNSWGRDCCEVKPSQKTITVYE